MYYILRGHEPVPCELEIWASQFEKCNRRVNRTETPNGFISTVFLGLDHSFLGGPPILFETMVFGGTLDGLTERYSTWDEAEKGHEEMFDRVMEATS